MPKCIAAVFKAALELFRGLLLELPRELFRALFSQPKGRHSAGEARRRRAKRVRRYAPMTPAAPDPLPSHPAVRRSQNGPGERPHAKLPTALPASTAPTTALKPPSVEFEADEIALVRPYFRAHESGTGTTSEADRVQGRAAARLRAWGADLDHLEFGPDSAFSFGPAPNGTRAYTLDEYRAPEPDPEPDPEPSALAAGATARTAARGSDCGVGGSADGSSGLSCGGSAEPADTFRVAGPSVPGALVPGPRVPARMSGLPHLSRIRARQQQRRARNLTGVGA